MTPRIPAPCHHELRPGTKVCLHCRRAEREATAARHQAIFVRIGITLAVIAAFVYAGFVGFAAWQDPTSSKIGRLMASPASLEAAPVATASPVPAPVATPIALVSDTTSAPVQVESSAFAAPRDTVIAPAPSAVDIVVPPIAPPVPVVAAPLEPVVAEGRTDLQNGIYAIRTGDTVIVHFDTPEARTRRPEKFEQIVRATLPGVHGSAADSMLATIAHGNLVGAGEFAAEPTVRAISLRAADGRSLSLWPQTRPGRDGPLVVAYRVTSSR